VEAGAREANAATACQVLFIISRYLEFFRRMFDPLEFGGILWPQLFSECRNQVICTDLLTRKTEVIFVIEHIVYREAHFLRSI
jgi:hypothetical protein